MKCKHCDYETDSSKILSVHEMSCLKVQEENGLIGQENNFGAEGMNWNELKKYASEKGITVKGKTKEVILQELSELESDQDDNNSGEGEGNPSDNNSGEGQPD